MAKKKPPIAEPDADDTQDPKLTKKLAGDKDLLVELRDRYKKCREAEQKMRDAYREDMKFIHVPGAQWDDATKTERGSDRPMFEFNRLRVTIKNVINKMRANRPHAKIRGIEDNDVDTAEVFEGLCRNIWNNSDGDSVIDYAAEHQVGGGMGAWRVSTEYADDGAFDQDIVIESIRNPMCLYADCAAQDPLKRDAKYWILASKLSKEAYEAKYGERDKVSFDVDEVEEELDDDEGVWVAEYWKQKPVTKQICLLSTGETVEKGTATYPEGVTVVKERTVNTYAICQYICSGDAVLEGPNEWASTDFPFVIVYGDYLVVDGKAYWCGLARYGKDAQKSHNWAMTSVIESVAATPQSKWWATAKQALGHTDKWAEANKKNFPFMLYNADPEASGPPNRMGAADVPSALMAVAGMSGDELKSVTGKFDASLGQASNETSGRAIRARQDEGDVATYNFPDNQLKGVLRTFEILVKLVPKIYDSQRSIRILGADGADKYVKINQQDPMTGEPINDLSKGKYDVVVTAGPNYQTQRMEAAEVYTGLAQADPTLMQIGGDIVFKSLDLPYADQMAERKRLMLPPQIQQALNKDSKQSPEVMAAMAQIDQLQQQVAEQAQAVAQAGQEVQGQQADAVKAKSAVDVQIANLRTEEAKFAADVANFKTYVAQQELKMAQTQGTQEVDNEREQLGAQVQQALAQIQTEAGAMLTQFAQAMAQLQAGMQPQVVVANQPKTKRAVSRRINGEIHTMIEEVPSAPSVPQAPQQPQAAPPPTEQPPLAPGA